MKFRYLPHTADIEFIAYGKTLGVLFRNSVLALLSAMSDTKLVGKDKAKPKSFIISTKAMDASNAIWYLLQDILSKIDALGVTGFNAEITKFSNKKDQVSVACKIFYKETKKYPRFDVKAVTPHDLAIKREKGVYKVKITLDV